MPTWATSAVRRSGAAGSVIVLPALVLNYFGQGALLLEHPSAISSPFYLMAPGWLLPVIIVLATAATVIASQAVISGVFSITRQALNLGYLPRLRVLHSSEEEIGQVYVPTVNWLLFAGTMTLILVFQSSSALAGAYGIAISSTMLIDSILVIMLLRVRQEARRGLVMAVLTFIVMIELAFFLSNLLKFDDGGWLPIAVAILVYVLMTTWQEGRRTLNWLVAKEQMPVRDFLALIEREPPHRVEGNAVYLASEAGGVPRALLNNLKFNRVLHAAQRAADVRAAGSAVRERRESRGDPEPRRGPVPHHRALRFHGEPERRRGAARRRRGRRAVRAGADRVRRRPRESDIRRRLGHAAVAQAVVRIHGP